MFVFVLCFLFNYYKLLLMIVLSQWDSPGPSRRMNMRSEGLITEFSNFFFFIKRCLSMTLFKVTVKTTLECPNQAENRGNEVMWLLFLLWALGVFAALHETSILDVTVSEVVSVCAQKMTLCSEFEKCRFLMGSSLVLLISYPVTPAGLGVSFVSKSCFAVTVQQW